MLPVSLLQPALFALLVAALTFLGCLLLTDPVVGGLDTYVLKRPPEGDGGGLTAVRAELLGITGLFKDRAGWS